MQPGRIFIGIFASGLLLIGLAFTTLLGSISTMSPQGMYGGIRGFFWLQGLAFCFLVGFWPWILVVIGISVILGTLYVPIISVLIGMALMGPPSGSSQWYQD